MNERMNECRHPQILLIPVQQFQRNVGYLMGQGVSKAELLQMWGLRAGLLIEPLRNLHGEVLALRSANRPLQVRRLLSQSQAQQACALPCCVPCLQGHGSCKMRGCIGNY